MIATLLAVLLLSPASAAPADGTVLEILTLRYRAAADVTPLLEPLLEGEGAISGAGTQIFVRATPARIARIKEALQAVDVEPRNLWISVRQVFDRRRTTRLRGDVATGHGFSGFEAGVQSVRTLEGSEALIEIRRDEPVRSQGLIVTQGGAAIVDDWFYEALGTGFYVVPRLVRDRFSLELVTRHSPAVGVPRQERELRTSLTGELGEWIEVGHVLEEHAVRHRGLVGGRAREERTEHSVLVKVEAIESR